MKRKKSKGKTPATSSATGKHRSQIDDNDTVLRDGTDKLTAKEIGRLAKRIFENTLPPNWVVRSQEDQEDYGVDFEIELTTANDQATGFIFKVQQKGTESIRLVKSGALVSYSDLECDKLHYYINKLRIPIILVVVDVASRQVYWLPLQGNGDVRSSLDEAVRKRQGKLTVHLPTGNRLPETAALLLQAVRTMMNSITVASIGKMQPVDLKTLIDSGHRLDDIDLRLRMAQLVVRSARTQQLINEGRFKEALALNERAYADDGEPLDARFMAGLEVIRTATGIDVHDPDSDPERLLELRVRVTNGLIRLTSRSPSTERLRHYAVFLARVSRMRVAVYRDMGIYVGRRSQLSGIDEYTKLVASGAQQQTANEILAHLRGLQRRMTEIVRGGWLELAIHGWSEVTEALGHFLLRLNSDDLADAAEGIRRWLDVIGSAVRAVAATVPDTNLVGLCALNHVRIGMGTDTISRRSEEARTLIETLKDPAGQKLLNEKLQMVLELARSTPSRLDVDDRPSVPLSPTALVQMVRQMARGLGVDLDNPSDRIAQIFWVGIHDYNPERVLRECQHLYVRLGSHGIPAQMIGLPTAGSKEICCTKHGHRSGAFSLDAGYEHFKSRNCASCADCRPHAADWKWNFAYQQEQDEQHGSRWPR